MPSSAAGTATSAASTACSAAIRAGREAERALHAERAQAPLDLGVRARGEHRPGGDQRDERERDEQRDHDPRGLREQDPHALAGDELRACPSPNDTARAWVSVTSAFEGSLSHSSATLASSGAKPSRSRIVASAT